MTIHAEAKLRNVPICAKAKFRSVAICAEANFRNVVICAESKFRNVVTCAEANFEKCGDMCLGEIESLSQSLLCVLWTAENLCMSVNYCTKVSI